MSRGGAARVEGFGVGYRTRSSKDNGSPRRRMGRGPRGEPRGGPQSPAAVPTASLKAVLHA